MFSAFIEILLNSYQIINRPHIYALQKKHKAANLTELCTILDTDFGNGKFSTDELHNMCQVLLEKGPEHIVVTGIPFHKKQIMNYIYSKGEDPQIVMVDRIGEDRSGTGDIISSVIAGMYM